MVNVSKVGIIGILCALSLTACLGNNRRPPSNKPPIGGQTPGPNEADQSRGFCRTGLVANALPVFYPKSPTATCASAVAVAMLDLKSLDYRTSCLNRFGGELPPSVLNVRASCSETNDHFIVSPEVCCPNPCKDLDLASCQKLGVCAWGRCGHVKGMLTCSDLSTQELCDRYTKTCDWNPAKCEKFGILPFECNDLSAVDCGRHSECGLQTECRYSSGSLTCDDLDSGQCSRYGTWCNFRDGKCRKKLLAGPFECRNLNAQDCSVESECSLRETCRHQSGSLTCADLSVGECNSYHNKCQLQNASCKKDPGQIFTPFTCLDLQKPDCLGQAECSYAEKCFHKEE